MRQYILGFLLFVVPFTLLAQSNAPEDYQSALRNLKSKNYGAAIPIFLKYTDESQFGNLALFSSLHLAEAQLGLMRYEDAISTVSPLANRNWVRTEEAKYILSLGYFGNGQNLEALREISKIQNSEILAKAENASFEKLKDESPNFLVANLEEFSSNQGYMGALQFVLANSEVLSASDRAAYYELRGKQGTNNAKDLVLDVVILLPFTGNGDNRIQNNGFVYELFQGLKMGMDRLRSNGMDVALSTFDTKRDLNHLQRVLSEPSVTAADIIIGPIYPDESDVVSAFAESQGIPFIHPLSNLQDRFEDRDFSFLFRPSLEALSDGILASLKAQNWGDSVAIGYGGGTRDRMLAGMLDQKLKNEGFRVVASQEVNSRNVRDFMQGLGIRPSLDSVAIDTNQLILLTDNPNISQPAFFLMESVTTTVPILVMDSWLGFNFANFEILSAPNFYFISNNTPNFGSEKMADFRRNFYEKFSDYPSLNTFLGYELIYWIGQNMSASKGFDLRRNLDQGSYQNGELSWGFNFQNSNSNTFVPVFKLEMGELKPLN
ncbi:amino acid ABC transporter substrate-binding protein [Algoriphagus sediminis]|uniref:Amino acid ABC transporter substrate-binding protein n=1 Tax=Algoriphagus sediminis TaxID=3057113 RepID=A0ABT7Y8B4_9BACT|nr:amino acid ABC transporter substrate-binding protein [Algoriphagus sediminis]MDN3202741.1 amino acid ABC transporter substrate-binding protein [Algoriphagus sediminis]